MRIALYQGKSFISRCIRWQTRSRYSHAAFLLDDGSVIEAWQPCVRWVENLSAQHEPGTRVDIFEFICPLTPAENSRLDWLVKQDVGTPYDYRSIVRFLTRDKGDASKRKLFCSEQVFARCLQIGRPLLDRTEAWRVPPDWIARSPLLNLTKTFTTTRP